tara:strand:+ start:197 stop:520 length:324 start_codon:yes stop_codon:yes gene_type:complete
MWLKVTKQSVEEYGIGKDYLVNDSSIKIIEYVPPNSHVFNIELHDGTRYEEVLIERGRDINRLKGYLNHNFMTEKLEESILKISFSLYDLEQVLGTRLSEIRNELGT